MDEPIGCGVEERGRGLMRGRGLPPLCTELSASTYGEGEGAGLREGARPMGCWVEERGRGLSEGRDREQS